MHVAREWQLKPRAVAQPLPAQPASLTTALQGMLPLPQDFIADPAQFTFAVVQGKVLVEAAQHRRELGCIRRGGDMCRSAEPIEFNPWLLARAVAPRRELP